MSDYYVYDEKGNYDEVSEKELFCLPIEKCYGFRLPIESDGFEPDGL